MQDIDIDNIELTYLSLDDYKELKKAMIESYQKVEDNYWEKHEIEKLISLFPEGQVVIKVNGQLAGCALSLIVKSRLAQKRHTYKQITGDYTFSTHDPEGDVLYGVDLFIKPEFRGLRLGRRLYDYRKELCERMNLLGIAFGGRIPNYHKYAMEISPRQYIEKVRKKEIDDPVLNFQINNDFHVSKILKGYLQGDEESKEYAVLLEWDNIYHEEETDQASTIKKSSQTWTYSVANASI